MPKFGKSSTDKLMTCHKDIRKLFNKVVQKYDCTVLEGARTLERQKELFNSGRSKTMNSKHLRVNGVSRAIDCVPYPISWGELEERKLRFALENRTDNLSELMNDYKIAYARFYHFAGYVKGVAEEMNIKIRWGGDWNGNFDLKDQTFFDLPHFELLD